MQENQFIPAAQWAYEFFGQRWPIYSFFLLVIVLFLFIRLVGHVKRLAKATERQAKALESISDCFGDVPIKDLLQTIAFQQAMPPNRPAAPAAAPAVAELAPRGNTPPGKTH